MRFVKQAAADLSANRGGGLVFAGRALSPEANALVHWINARLQAPVDLIEPGDRTAGGREAGTLSSLTRDLQSGAVDQLVVIGANPGYHAPADLEFAKHSAKTAFRLHVGCYVDETAALSTWHVPQTHDLEAWSDLRSCDGTASIVQPLIRPLYRTWTEHEILALLTGHGDASPYDLVRETWRPEGWSQLRGLVDPNPARRRHCRKHLCGGDARTTHPSRGRRGFIHKCCHDRRLEARSKPLGRHLCQ